jgi:hypothetical protein
VIRHGGPDVLVAFARAVAGVVGRPDGTPPSVDVEALESLLDGWASGPDAALASAAVSSYGEVDSVRPDWWSDEIGKLRRAAADARPAVRDAVVRATARLLVTSPDRTAAALDDWSADPDPLVADTARRARRAGPPA